MPPITVSERISMRASDLEDAAGRILQQEPDPVVRHLLLRDVLRRRPNCAELVLAREALDGALAVRRLRAEQKPDGGWGGFHSRSELPRRMIASTEVGVERAVALGLDQSHPILRKASRYIIDIMEGHRRFPDRHEKNDRWQTGMRLFLASTLSLIHPSNPVLDADRRLWCEIAARTFQSGKYDEQDEIEAHAELTGASVRHSYLVLNNRYSLNILGSVRELLPSKIEKSLLDWLWKRDDGIGYLGVSLGEVPPHARAGPFDRWFSSLELLASCFSLWRHNSNQIMRWLWNQRDENGFWDFGPSPSHICHFPLSGNWKRRRNRVFDWTTRALIILRMFLDPPEHRPA